MENRFSILRLQIDMEGWRAGKEKEKKEKEEREKRERIDDSLTEENPEVVEMELKTSLLV